MSFPYREGLLLLPKNNNNPECMHGITPNTYRMANKGDCGLNPISVAVKIWCGLCGMS